MPSIRQLTLSSFCLLLTVCGVNACGSQFTEAAASSASPVTASSTNATQSNLSNVGAGFVYRLSVRWKRYLLNPPLQHKVKVFFPRSPKSGEDFTYVEPVWRATSSKKLVQFAIEQLIAGPTTKQKAIGLVAPIKFRGSSNCGRDFTVSISNKVAKLQFCKLVVSGGIGDDARIRSSINATLKQFTTIKTAIVLDKNGNCLGDESGENFCLK